MKDLTIAILGATGVVGQEILKLLAARRFPVARLRLLGERSAGRKMIWQGQECTIEQASAASFDCVDLTFAAVDSDVSKRLVPAAVQRGSIVIDNSSAYRLDPCVPLVVPEVNPEDIRQHQGIIANPNCSTIIAMTAVKPLHDRSPIRRMVVATYQAVSGAGRGGITELERQIEQLRCGEAVRPEVFPHQIAYNVIPHIDSFDSHGYTKEEMKLLHEGRKILRAPDLRVSCTCVRVPVWCSHSLAITLETEKSISVDLARELLGRAPGVKMVDDPSTHLYPMPIAASDQDLVLVGRIRTDISAENSLSIWVCGDQLRKGAATNAVQIAELLLKEGLI